MKFLIFFLKENEGKIKEIKYKLFVTTELLPSPTQHCVLWNDENEYLLLNCPENSNITDI